MKNFNNISMKELENILTDGTATTIPATTTTIREVIKAIGSSENSLDRLLKDYPEWVVTRVSVKDSIGKTLESTKDYEFMAYMYNKFNTGKGDIINEWVLEEYNYFMKRKAFIKKALAAGLPSQLWWLYETPQNWIVEQYASTLAVIGRKIGLFKIDEESRKLIYFDSKGYYGISEYTLLTAWNACGRGQNIGYFETMLKYLKERNYANKNWGFYAPKKELTLSELTRFNSIKNKINNISNKLILRLIKLSYESRMAILTQVKELNANCDLECFVDRRNGKETYRKPIHGCKAINWNVLKQSQRERIMQGESYDSKYQWYWYANKLNVRMAHADMDTLMRSGIKPLLLSKEQYCFVISKSNSGLHVMLGVKNALVIYGRDMVAINKISNNELGSVFSFTNKLNESEATIAAEMVKRDIRFVGIFNEIPKIIERNKGEIPSFEQAEMLNIEYNEVQIEELAIVARQHKLGKNTFSAVQKAVLKTKKVIQGPSVLPLNISVSIKGYTLKFLERGDYRGLFLGKITNCCQTVGDAGGSCAKAGYRRPDMGFVVIEDSKNEIITQSWVWSCYEGGMNIILDSIESKGIGNREDIICELYSKFAAECRKENINILIGCTNYGVTPIVRKRVCSEERYNFRALDYNGYLDGKEQTMVL